MHPPRNPVTYGKTGITLEAPVVCQDGELEWAIVYACRKYTTVKSVSDATRSSLDAKLVTALSAARNLTIIPTLTPDTLHQMADTMYGDVVFHTLRAPRKETPDGNSPAAVLLAHMAAATKRLHETRAKYMPQEPLEETPAARYARDMGHDEAVRNVRRGFVGTVTLTIDTDSLQKTN